MKKFLLFLLNSFVDVKSFTKDFIHRIIDCIYTIFHKPPVIMTCEETIKHILETNCCVTRFGDGEIKLLKGQNIYFQKADPGIQQAYKKILSEKKENLLVCIPSVFSSSQREIYSQSHKKYWIRHLSYFRKYWYRDLNFDRVYGNAFISRHYMNLKDKKNGIAEYFSLVKKLWENKDIIIVEGEKSRLGMGNDLFDNAKSIRRILCPSAQCFSKYDEILEEVKRYGKEPLYILALGPSATILAYDLCVDGYTAIDMGNIDTEYEWFRMNATKKIPIKDKMVYEAGAGVGVGDVDDPEYLSQIVSKIV